MSLSGEYDLAHLMRKHNRATDKIPPDIKQLRRIIYCVGNHYCYAAKYIIARRRYRHLSLCRNMIYYIANVLYDFSLPLIATHMGNRQHSTVQRGRERFKEQLDGDKEIADALHDIRMKLAKGLAV